VSDSKDLLDDGNSDDDGGDNDDNGDNDDQAINLPDTAATNNDNGNDDDEGVPRKTLFTATIRRKTDTANANILEGGALNRPTMKL
jgi:hypothetical protein